MGGRGGHTHPALPAFFFSLRNFVLGVVLVGSGQWQLKRDRPCWGVEVDALVDFGSLEVKGFLKVPCQLLLLVSRSSLVLCVAFFFTPEKFHCLLFVSGRRPSFYQRKGLSTSAKASCSAKKEF